jgi:hypothetical protein
MIAKSKLQETGKKKDPKSLRKKLEWCKMQSLL